MLPNPSYLFSQNITGERYYGLGLGDIRSTYPTYIPMEAFT